MDASKSYAIELPSISKRQSSAILERQSNPAVISQLRQFALLRQCHDLLLGRCRYNSCATPIYSMCVRVAPGRGCTNCSLPRRCCARLEQVDAFLDRSRDPDRDVDGRRGGPRSRDIS